MDLTDEQYERLATKLAEIIPGLIGQIVSRKLEAMLADVSDEFTSSVSAGHDLGADSGQPNK